MSRKKRKSPKPRPRKPRPKRTRPGSPSRPSPSRAATEDSGLKRWSRLLTKVQKDPASGLRDPRCLKLHFLNELFDLCESKALEVPWTAPDLVKVAVELAERNGDPHLIQRASGVSIHVLINTEQYEAADEALQESRQAAFDCCTGCAAEWFQRQGDLLVETRDTVMARAYLGLATEILGAEIDDDTRGRIVFVRGIAHFYLGLRDLALADIDEALQLLSLTASSGYFPDAIALIPCFLQGGDERRHDEEALAILARFRPRLKNVKDVTVVRDRMRWVEGLARARLGQTRRAKKRLTTARAGHLKHSPHRYALAIAVDEALVLCRNHPETFIRSIRQIITFCKRNLKLEEEHRRNLLQAARDLGQAPHYSREILARLRLSYIVPVPGLLCDEVAPAEEERAAKERDGTDVA